MIPETVFDAILNAYDNEIMESPDAKYLKILNIKVTKNARFVLYNKVHYMIYDKISFQKILDIFSKNISKLKLIFNPHISHRPDNFHFFISKSLRITEECQTFPESYVNSCKIFQHLSPSFLRLNFLMLLVHTATKKIGRTYHLVFLSPLSIASNLFKNFFAFDK